MENIRNFVIISHIDHGKSTLADRFLELTGTVSKGKMRQQYLDSMDLEKERGITIKMHPVRMRYDLGAKTYQLNLIDTPGHVDFAYEVSRALACVEGAILLVDATKGIQAQTIANLEQAKSQNLIIIPAVNKIDSPQAKIKKTKTELADLLNISENEIFEISAKQGINIAGILEAVIQRIPPPSIRQLLIDGSQGQFKALIFDSKYDHYKGAIAFIRVFDGKISIGEKVNLFSNKVEGIAKEIGYFSPELLPQKELTAGEIGYLATGIKDPGKVRVGDTIFTSSLFNKLEPLPGYKEPKPMVLASLYPEDPNDFDILQDGLGKLKLNDASLAFEPEMREGLGRGFRCGFLGTLHAEVVAERLRREFNLNLVVTTPQVIYKISNHKNQEITIYSSSDWPSPQEIKEAREPWVELEILSPNDCLGDVFELLRNYKAEKVETKNLSQDKQVLLYKAPLRIIIAGLNDKLKSKSHGFASMNYEFSGYRTADLVKLDILVAGKKEEAFTKIVPKNDAFSEGKTIVAKLKKALPTQLFSVPLQAAIGGKIIARETLRAKGKDVIAPLYGGDYTRKKKLLERQKKGKKELKEKGKIRIPQNVFFEIFKH